MPLLAKALTRTLMGEISTTLVRDISLTIPDGQLVAITGPSGSGKSSLLYLLGLLDTPTSGDVLIDGISTANLDEDERAAMRLTKFGFIFQFHFLLPELTVADNVRLPMQQLGNLNESAMMERTMTLLEQVDLAAHAHKLPGQLSGGQRQRVAIARALANNPRFILADEPTGALDTKNGQAVFALLQQLAQQGHSVMMVTHATELEQQADIHYRLVDGQLLA